MRNIRNIREDIHNEPRAKTCEHYRCDIILKHGYQTWHTHGRYVPPPGLPGRRSASAALLAPHTEQTHAHTLKCTDCAQGCEDATLWTQRRRGMRTCPPNPARATGPTMAPPWRPPSWRRVGRSDEAQSHALCLSDCLSCLSQEVFGGVALLRQ